MKSQPRWLAAMIFLALAPLFARGEDDTGGCGRALGCAYHLLGAMLLNEVQKQYAQIAEQALQISNLRAQLAELAGRLKQLER